MNLLHRFINNPCNKIRWNPYFSSFKPVNDEATHTRTPQQYRIGAAIYFFISGFGYSTWASRIPTIKQQLHLNEAQLGTVLFALPIGLMLTMPVTNRLLMYYSSRAVMLFGCLFLSIDLVLIGFTTTLWELAAVLFFFGMARNLMTLSINTQGVAVQALYKKSIMATFHGIWSMAGFAGAAVGLVMVFFNIAPRWHFIGVAIVLDVLTIYFINHTLPQKPVARASTGFSLPDNFGRILLMVCLTGFIICLMFHFQVPPGYIYGFLVAIVLAVIFYFVFALFDPHLFKFSLICFCCMACENTMYDWSALYFQKQVNPDKTIATAAFVVYLVAMTAGRFFGDRIVTRMGIKAVLKFSGLFIFFGLLGAVVLPYTITAALGFVLVGFGVSCVVPMVFSLAGKSKNMSSSSALASISTIGYLGFVLVPPFVGYIAQTSGLRVSFALIALFGAVIVFLVSKIRDEKGENISAPARGLE